MTERRATPQRDPISSSQENERQYRVLDQMLTAHSWMRDRLQRRSMTLKVCLFCSAIAVSGFAFADEKLFKVVGLTPEVLKLMVGVGSLFVMTLSVVELLVGWERKAALHEDCTKRLAALKLRYRKAHTSYHGKNVRVNDQLTKEWERLNKTLPHIPDHHFIRLKHRHHIKRQLSELAELNRQIPYSILVVMYYSGGLWKGIKSGLAHPPMNDSENTTNSAAISSQPICDDSAASSSEPK